MTPLAGGRATTAPAGRPPARGPAHRSPRQGRRARPGPALRAPPRPPHPGRRRPRRAGACRLPMTCTRQMAQVSHSTSQLHMATAFHFFSENILSGPPALEPEEPGCEWGAPGSSPSSTSAMAEGRGRGGAGRAAERGCGATSRPRPRPQPRAWCSKEAAGGRKGPSAQGGTCPAAALPGGGGHPGCHHSAYSRRVTGEEGADSNREPTTPKTCLKLPNTLLRLK